jgi:hypothetical protein
VNGDGKGIRLLPRDQSSEISHSPSRSQEDFVNPEESRDQFLPRDIVLTPSATESEPMVGSGAEASDLTSEI